MFHTLQQPASPCASAVEQIIGPICGFHLACYTVRTPEGVFAYAKVCALRPDCVWTADSSVGKVAAGPFAQEEAALAGVTEKARLKIQRGLNQSRFSRLLHGLVRNGFNKQAQARGMRLECMAL